MDRNGFRRIPAGKKFAARQRPKKRGWRQSRPREGAGSGGRLKAGIRIGGTSAPG